MRRLHIARLLALTHDVSLLTSLLNLGDINAFFRYLRNNTIC